MSLKTYIRFQQDIIVDFMRVKEHAQRMQTLDNVEYSLKKLRR